ncbi:MAG TPA: flagellar export chaperone FliS [Gemmatirosa sp.]
MSYPAYAHTATAAQRFMPRPPAAAAAAAAPARPQAAQVARYRDAELAGATPGQLVVMLFDKCVLTVRRAQAALAAGDIPARTAHICAAADMLAELRGSLDFDAGGDISRQLDSLYAYGIRELFAANRAKDPAKLASVLHVVSELRDAFAGANAQVTAAQAAAPRLRST